MTQRAPLLLVVTALAAGLFFALPVLGLLTRAPWHEVAALLESRAAVQAFWLSAAVSLGATGASLLLAGPLAWVLARTRMPGRRGLRALVGLPLVLPPVVAGVALLAAFGRRGLLGGAFDLLGVQVPFTTAAAVLAATFVAAPLLATTLESALAQTDPRLERVAATLGASRLRIAWTVLLPALRPALIGGLALCWARALGEFGATITFAGNLRGRTQTLPLAIYETLQTDPDRAFLLACALLGFSGMVLAVAWGRPSS